MNGVCAKARRKEVQEGGIIIHEDSPGLSLIMVINQINENFHLPKNFKVSRNKIANFCSLGGFKGGR